MIITCKCKKYEFEVNKNEIPKDGRDVQCGVCNEVWFQTPYEKRTNLKINKNYFSNILIFLIFLLSCIGTMEILREYLVFKFPILIQYYDYINFLNQQINFYLELLLSFFSVRN
ncbi:MAG: hypothetical protein ISQ17_03045 [Pelagibacteraceae bacterium]|nr:hypothetical protein [Pelagibacteraceae bacterium]